MMLPRVSGNSPSTLCRLLIEFVLVIEFVNKLPVVLMIVKPSQFLAIVFQALIGSENNGPYSDHSSYPFGLLMMIIYEGGHGDDDEGRDLLPILLPTRDCALEAAMDASLLHISINMRRERKDVIVLYTTSTPFIY